MVIVFVVFSAWMIFIEGVYALHPEIRQSLDLWVAVVRYFSTLLFLLFLPFTNIFLIKNILIFVSFTNQVGGVHSHLISRVQRDKSRIGCFMSQNEIMMTVFPMFQQHIEPHLVHAHVSTPEILDFTY